jgi:hypothetical protein
MSIRTLVELSHDHFPGNREEEADWLAKMRAYYRCGHPEALPRGVSYVYLRHHSQEHPADVLAERLSKL